MPKLSKSFIFEQHSEHQRFTEDFKEYSKLDLSITLVIFSWESQTQRLIVQAMNISHMASFILFLIKIFQKVKDKELLTYIVIMLIG
jgi:hypothetical protein